MALAKSPLPHKRVRWRQPGATKGKRWPGVLDATRAELVRGIELHHGSLWPRIRSIVIVAGYALDRALHRVRGLRRDGAESLLAMAVALLYLADVRTGFIGKPRNGGGPWQRYTLADLAQLAYGAQGVAELRRARRAIDMMISLGWAFRTKQVRRYLPENDTFVGLAGVRRLNFGRICEMTGTSWLLKRDRIHADANKGSNVAALQTPRGQGQRTGRSADEAQAKLAAAARHRAGQPHATGDPDAGPRAFAHIGKLLFDEG